MSETENCESVLDSFLKNFKGNSLSDKDIQEFGERVQTFLEGQKWVYKPLVLSPAVCAQYGWKCKNSNLLECVTCNAKLCTSEPKIDLFDAYKDCINKILRDLKESHKTHCPWPLTPLPDSFVKMSTMPKEESLKHFVKRLTISIEFYTSLPVIKDSSFRLLDTEEESITSLCKVAGISAEVALKFRQSAVVLAATGWSLTSNEEKSHQKVFVKCESCQRSIWSQAFNLLHSSDANSGCTDSSSQSKESPAYEQNPVSFKRLKKEDFDPLEEHRLWCLWVSSCQPSYVQKSDSTDQSKKGDPSLPGWKIFLKSLQRNVVSAQTSTFEEKPSKEQIRSIRNSLETWIGITDMNTSATS